MSLAGVFDTVFVNQLFGKTARGETVFYPNGVMARGYIVPREREPAVRSALRWLVLSALAGTLAVVVIVPRVVETWLGYPLPLAWFMGGALVVLVLGVSAIIVCLARLTVGLTPLQR